MSFVFDLHVDLTHIVGALRDGLDGEFLECHLTMDDGLESLDGCVDRTVAGGCTLELLVGDEQTDAGDAADTLARGDLQVVELDVVRGGAVGTGQHHDVVVRNLFLLVGQVEEVLINLIETFSVDFYAVDAEAMLQGGTSAAGGQHDGIVVDAHVLRVHDFVGGGILQHAVLVDAAAMGEGVAAYDGLVGLHGHVHQRADHAAGGIDLCRVDVGVDAEVGMRLEYHRNLFERRIACTFADAVDGHLCLTGAVQHACHGVGGRHAEVVVAMGGENAPSGCEGVDVFVEVLYLLAVLVGSAEASRVGNVADGSSSLGDGIDDAGQVLVVRAACIFGIELHVLDVPLGVLHGTDGTLDDFLGRGVELVADVALARADACVDAFVLGVLQSLGSAVDILLHGAGQSADGRPCDGLADFYHTIEVARARDGEACLDDIYAKCLKLLGNLNFLYRIELTAGHLLAVPQSRVEDEQFVTHIFRLIENFPFICATKVQNNI